MLFASFSSLSNYCVLLKIPSFMSRMGSYRVRCINALLIWGLVYHSTLHHTLFWHVWLHKFVVRSLVCPSVFDLSRLFVFFVFDEYLLFIFLFVVRILITTKPIAHIFCLVTTWSSVDADLCLGCSIYCSAILDCCHWNRQMQSFLLCRLSFLAENTLIILHIG